MRGKWLTVLCLVAVTAFAGEVPPGYVDISVPIAGDGKSTATGFRAVVEGGVRHKHNCAIPSYKHGENIGKPATKYARVTVAVADVERVTNRIPEDQVPIRDLLYVGLARCRRKSGTPMVPEDEARVKALFTAQAALWQTPEGKALGQELLAQARAHGVSAAALADIEASCALR